MTWGSTRTIESYCASERGRSLAVFPTISPRCVSGTAAKNPAEEEQEEEQEHAQKATKISAEEENTSLKVGKENALAPAAENKMIANHLKLPPVKLHCSMLAEDAIKSAIENYISKGVN